MGHGAPYPLILTPILLEKVWGGRRLEMLGKTLPKPDARYGESWELADMAATSASGAGGGAVRSVIANGALRGRTVHEAMELWREALLPALAAHGQDARATFPLLVKFLDAPFEKWQSFFIRSRTASLAWSAGAMARTKQMREIARIGRMVWFRLVGGMLGYRS